MILNKGFEDGVRSQRSNSGKKSIFEKSPRDIANKFHGLMERYSNRLTLENLRLSERYHEGELHILICFRNRDSMDYIALIQRERCGGIGLKDKRLLLRGVSALDSDTLGIASNDIGRHAKSRNAQCCRDQGTMLVKNVQLVDIPEDSALSSFIWFDSLNSFDCLWPKSLYYSSCCGFVFRGFCKPLEELHAVSSDREVEILERSYPVCVNQDQSVNKMVESTTQSMDSISNDERQRIGNGPCTVKPPDSLSGIKVIIGADFISLDLKSIPFGTQIDDVLFGPFDLGGQLVEYSPIEILRHKQRLALHPA